MTQLIELPDYIYEEDHKGFLKTYLKLISEGYTLTIPTETKIEDVKEGWNEILQRISQDLTDKFVDSLSKLWVTLLHNRDSAVVGEHFVKEMLLMIDPTALDDEIENEQAPLPQPSQTRPKTPNIQLTNMQTKDPLDEDVTSSISPNYYKIETARKSEIPSKENLDKLILEAIKKNDAHAFLIHYLSKSKHNEKPRIPMSSVLEIIKTQWEEIILTDLNQIPPDNFLDQMGHQWFYLVNKNGLPYSIEHIKNILYTLMSTYKGPKKKQQKPKKMSALLNKLLRKKK